MHKKPPSRVYAASVVGFGGKLAHKASFRMSFAIAHHRRLLQGRIPPIGPIKAINVVLESSSNGVLIYGDKV